MFLLTDSNQSEVDVVISVFFFFLSTEKTKDRAARTPLKHGDRLR